ncbi:MAG: hypothetical protein U0638_13240 [Phycisphaerales bacterium]
MKLKGINPFEQYVDKAVFGIVGASLLGVLSWQFVGPGNQIEVAGQKVDPDKAYGPVKTQAQSIIAKVGSQSPELPAPPRADVLKRFEERLTKGVSPGKNIVALAPRLTLGGGNADLASTAEAPIAPLAVPAPTGVLGQTFASAINPAEVVASEELAKLLPLEQPFDKQAVSVEAVFDGTALAKALENDPEGDPRSIPLGWWRGQMGVVAVEMERERQVSSGEWGESTIVPPMPGRVSLLKDIDKTVKVKSDVPALVARADQDRDLIMRPAYYSIIAGPKWVPPSEAGTGESQTEKTDRLQRQLKDLQKEETAIRKRLEQQGKQADRPAGRDDQQPTGHRGTPGSGAGNAPKPPPDDRNRTRTTQKDKKNPLETKLEEVQRRIVKTQEELQKVNETDQAANKEPEKRAGLLEDPKARVWSHDLTAEPGATYRYRLRVVTNNPLYGQKLVEAQKADAETPVVRGDWSEWTDPITVEAKEYYFITGASPADQLGGARASAELYKFYYGFWRKGSASIEPGDVLAAQAKLPEDLRLWDMDKLKAGAKPKALPANPGEDRANPSGGRPGGRPLGRPAAHGSPDEGEAPAKDPTEKPKLEDDGLSKPGPKNIDFVVDAMMLDTSALPASGDSSSKARFRTFFRNHAGQIVVRYPDLDNASDLYKRLLANAKLGENQGRPKVETVDPQKSTDPDQNGPGRRRPRPDREEEETKPSGG